MAAVEDGRQLVFGDHLVERPGHAVVGQEALHRGVELEALDAVLLDQPRASRAPILPLCGSMLAKAIIMSLFFCAASADLLVRDAPAAQCDSRCRP
jgi:hypothetical protein